MVARKEKTNNIQASITFLAAIIIRLLNPSELNLSAGIYEYIAVITLFILWLWGTRKKIFTKRSYTKFELLGFAVFSFFSSLSYLYYRECSLHDMSVYMGIYLACAFVINFMLAQYGYQLIGLLLKHGESKPIKIKVVAKHIAANNFWFYFGCLFITYLFFLIINYPGTLMFDPMIQIKQIYNIPNITTSQVNLINPNQFITTHHPFIHTMLIKLFLSMGEVVGSLDVGIFLYSLFQITVMAFATAYLLKYIHKFFSDKGVLNWLLLFSLNPIVLMYTSLMTKDTLFAVFFALFGIKFYEYIKDSTVMKNKKWFFSFITITVLCSLFRNNFFYAALLTFVVLLITRKDKGLLKAVAIYLCVCFVYSSVLVPGLGISKGSIREAISVPFQQTANYAKHYDVTDEEKEAISKILDFETVRAYNYPEISNEVKNTYNKDATTEDLATYFKTWGKMFFKHPLAYFDAYFNQFYGYFSTRPYFSASYYMAPNLEAREMLINAGVNLSDTLPFMNAKQVYDVGLVFLSAAPVGYLITNSGVYVWILMAAIAFLLKKGKKEFILFYLPFVLYFATLLLSPANASVEYRYMFPYLMALPILLAPVREQIKREDGEHKAVAKNFGETV